ncbi:MAG: WD40 repeat domain-containing protein [Candidatus Acidiferrales bacterium]
MPTLPPTAEIVTRKTQSLAVRTAALVRRGLRDLTVETHWRVRKVSAARHGSVAVSPFGQMAALETRPGSPRVSLTVEDLESETLPEELPLTIESVQAAGLGIHVVRWSPDGRYILAASPDWNPEAHLFDVERQSCLRTYPIPSLDDSFAWSPDGNIFGLASAADCSVNTWLCRNAAPTLDETPHGSLDPSLAIRNDSAEAEPGEVTVLAGFGPMAFSIASGLIAVALRFPEEWADDHILLAAAPSLSSGTIVPIQGNATDMSWDARGENLIFCAGGKVFAANLATRSIVPLPFNAEICRCHPILPICACYSSWLKDSENGRLFITEARTGRIVDECDAEGVVDLCWSVDGERVYAVTRDGLAYIYDRSLG